MVTSTQYAELKYISRQYARGGGSSHSCVLMNMFCWCIVSNVYYVLSRINCKLGVLQCDTKAFF